MATKIWQRTGGVATLVVAASNATEKEKAMADVVLTGANDEVGLAAAFTSNRKVVLTGGTYNIQAACNITSVTDLTIILSPGAIVDRNYANDGLTFASCTNISIEGGEWYATDTTAYTWMIKFLGCTNCKVEHCYFNHFVSGVFAGADTDNHISYGISVNNNEFYNYSYAAVGYSNGTSYSECCHNKFHCLRHGAEASGPYAFTTDSEGSVKIVSPYMNHITIAYNKIWDADRWTPIDLHGGRNYNIIGNQIDGKGITPADTALIYYHTVTDTAEPTTGGDITCDIADANPDTITRTAGGSGSFITDGFQAGDKITISNSAQPGNNATFTAETVTDTIITVSAGDTLTAQAGDTITIVGAGESHSINILDNICTNAPWVPILVSNAEPAYTMEGINISNNICDIFDDAGIYVVNSGAGSSINNVVIKGNQLIRPSTAHQWTSYGILLENTGATCTGVLITGNHVDCQRWGGTYGTTYAIYPSNWAGVAITANQVVNTIYGGIRCENCDDALIASNYVSGAAASFISADGDDMVVTANRFIATNDNVINIANANVVRCMIHGNNFQGSSSNLTSAGATNPRIASNIDKDGAWAWGDNVQ